MSTEAEPNPSVTAGKDMKLISLLQTNSPTKIYRVSRCFVPLTRITEMPTPITDMKSYILDRQEIAHTFAAEKEVRQPMAIRIPPITRI